MISLTIPFNAQSFPLRLILITTDFNIGVLFSATLRTGCEHIGLRKIITAQQRRGIL